jgi:hypothetical protein
MAKPVALQNEVRALRVYRPSRHIRVVLMHSRMMPSGRVGVKLPKCVTRR